MFFNMPELKRGECDLMPYKIASRKAAKQGKAYYVTPVTWEGAPIVKTIVNLKRLGAVEVVTPPPLPKGYRMVDHDSLCEIYENLYTPSKKDEYSFQDLDDIIQDSWSIESITKSHWELGIYDDRRDYCEWCCLFDEAWESLRSDVKELFARANPHTYAAAKVLGDRVMPPDLKTALLNMVALLESESAEKQD